VNRGGARAAVLVLPTWGMPTGLRIDARTVYVWWGPDESGNDVVAALGNVDFVFKSSDACWAVARKHQWPGYDDVEIANAGAPILDFDPVLDWLRGRRCALDPVAALNLWNTAADLALSTEQPWDASGASRTDCYDKLFFANVPWAADLDTYRPQWSKCEINTLRATMGNAVRVVRSALGGEHSTQSAPM